MRTHIFKKGNYYYYYLRVQFIANMEIESEMRWKLQIQYFACFSKPIFSFSKHEFRSFFIFICSQLRKILFYLFIYLIGFILFYNNKNNSKQCQYKK